MPIPAGVAQRARHVASLAAPQAPSLVVEAEDLAIGSADSGVSADKGEYAVEVPLGDRRSGLLTFWQALFFCNARP